MAETERERKKTKKGKKREMCYITFELHKVGHEVLLFQQHGPEEIQASRLKVYTHTHAVTTL